MSKTVSLGNNTIIISEAFFISSRNIRKRQTVNGALLNVFLRGVYPIECQSVVSCNRQFRQSLLDKFKNVGKSWFWLEVPLEDEQI